MAAGKFETEKHLVIVGATTTGINQPWIGTWKIASKADPSKVLMSGSTDPMPTTATALDAARVNGTIDAQEIEYQAANSN